MLHRRTTSAFSLVEVVIAVGIFAVSVAAIIGLLPSLTRRSAEGAEASVAHSLTDAVKVELQRVGFSALGGAVPVMGTPLNGGYAMWANRDGSKVTTQTAEMPQADRFYLIEAWKYQQAPLAYDATGDVLALHVRVSWPYYNPGAPTSTPLSERSQFTFAVTLNR